VSPPERSRENSDMETAFMSDKVTFHGNNAIGAIGFCNGSGSIMRVILLTICSLSASSPNPIRYVRIAAKV